MVPDKASLWAAAKRFEGILRSDPKAYSFAPLSDVYRQLGLIDDALQTARSGAALYPDFAGGQLALAKAAIESGFRDEAVSALESVVRVTPENIEAQRLLADLYNSAGNASGAQRCLSIADSLDISVRTDVSCPAPLVAEVEEELLDADILELSDEFIEEDSFEDPAAQFSASPSRPSLGESVNRAEPFLMNNPPPLYEKVEPAAEVPVFEEPAFEEPVQEQPVMASATIAELYVNQGFTEKGAAVYRDLLASDPGNKVYEKRLLELTDPESLSPAPVEVCRQDGLLDKLQDWLGNIGRVKECRTKSL